MLTFHTILFKFHLDKNSHNIVDCDGGDSDNDTDDLIEDAKNFIELGRRLDVVVVVLTIVYSCRGMIFNYRM